MDKFYRKNDVVNGYTIKRVIGQGRYGIVYLCENENKEIFVIKQLKNEMLEKGRSKLFYETELLQKIDHPSFPKLIDTFNDDGREGYILEYIQGPVFEDIIVVDNCYFTKQEIYLVASQLLDIIEFLHKNKIVHRDIRLPNVILKPDRELALIDFGLARYIDDKRYKEEVDYWFLGDFLIHLYYTTFEDDNEDLDLPWHEELDLTNDERIFLKKLMGLDGIYTNIDDIRKDLEKLKDMNNI